MKKYLFMFLTLALFICFTLPLFAASVKIECESALELNGGANIQDFTSASGLQIIGLKPDDVEIESSARFEIDITEDGIYTFTITYAASAGDAARKADISINGERKPLDLKHTADWDTYDTASVTYELFTGKHELIFHSPTDYDNVEVKTPNLDFFEYEKTSDLIAIVIEETIEPIPVPLIEENVQTTIVTAPQTFDSSIVFILIFVISGSALIYSKKLIK